MTSLVSDSVNRAIPGETSRQYRSRTRASCGSRSRHVSSRNGAHMNRRTFCSVFAVSATAGMTAERTSSSRQEMNPPMKASSLAGDQDPVERQVRRTSAAESGPAAHRAAYLPTVQPSLSAASSRAPRNPRTDHIAFIASRRRSSTRLSDSAMSRSSSKSFSHPEAKSHAWRPTGSFGPRSAHASRALSTTAASRPRLRPHRSTTTRIFSRRSALALLSVSVRAQSSTARNTAARSGSVMTSRRSSKSPRVSSSCCRPGRESARASALRANPIRADGIAPWPAPAASSRQRGRLLGKATC